MPCKDAPPQASSRLYLKLAPEDLALCKFILEGFDNLAYLTIVDKYEAVARLSFSPCQQEEVRGFLLAAGEELDLEILQTPTMDCSRP
jgi:hypothetical protein